MIMPFTEEDKAVFRHVKRYGTKRFLKEVLNRVMSSLNKLLTKICHMHRRP